MLEQNFLPAAELELSEVEKEALIKVLGMLERGEIRDTNFSMNIFLREDEGCGTIGCLAGWANSVSNGLAFPTLAGLSPKVNSLFWNSVPGVIWSIMAMRRPTVEEGAQVLRTFLTTGEVTWPAVLKRT